MAEQFYTILTNTGKAKIANALPTGTKVNLTKMKIGDSNGTYYNPSESQTELVHKVYECNVTSVEVDESNPNWITITATIPSDVGGFSIREVGVFDDSNSLIAIGKYPETYKPVASDGSVKELYIKMTLEVVNASSVELKIDPTIILATKKDIANINTKVEDVTTQLDTNTKYQDFKSGQSPKEFGAIPLHENSSFDSSDIIQGIIDTLATREFGGILVIDDTYGVSKPIYLKENVQIQGKASISFFNGMIYYSDTPANIYSPRLKAINVIDDAVLIIENKDGVRKHESRSISNFIIDGNKLANHCLKLVGKDNKRQEDNTLIENIACQGATSHGVYCKETLTNKLINLNVSACNGYGIYLAYGFCDSVLINPYIHTNQGGGIYIGDGCSYLNITGGKIEDNYALGIKGYKCNKIYINGAQFHANNDKHILVDGENSKINVSNCVLANADKSAIDNKKTVQVINNGTITLRGCEISGTDYIVEATSGGTINLFNNDINVTTSMVKNRSSLNLNEVDNIVNGKLQRYNQGSQLKKISIEPSSRGSVIFENLFDFSRYGTPYACLASYNLTIITTQYAQNGASKIFKGILSVGKSNTTYGTNIITLTESNDTTWISSVGCELINDNKDIKITINTGTNVGKTSGFKDFYIYLEDIGHNSFLSLT